jgi:formiminotetrahydrofolate cyclodeaminase
VAALSAALSAALLEKLIHHRPSLRRLHAIRLECAGLITRDAEAFARVVRALRSGDSRAFRSSLRAATEIPVRVFESAEAVQAICRGAQRSVKPRFQSDLRCAMAVAMAAAESARSLIQTNVEWLDDPAHARRVRRRLQAAQQHARVRP